MASVFRRAVDLAKEARMRGFWGTFQALKGKKLGMASCLVGTDKLGNRYYENKNVRYGRERWVEYRELETGEQLDSMNVPPEWHMWLHKMSDELPTNIAHPKYQGPILPNQTGTPEAYISPYNPRSKHFTGYAKDKIEAWDPKQSKKPASQQATETKDVLDLK